MSRAHSRRKKAQRRANRTKNAVRKPTGVGQKWTPFERGAPIDLTGNPKIDTKEVWLNSIYQVFVYRSEDWPKMIHLSIKTHDRSAIRDWRDLQRIKNELCGTTCEGVELFPAESRMTDLANQFHLWVLEPGEEFPFGWDDGRVVSTDPEIMAAALEYERKLGVGPSKAKQRDFKPHHTPEGCPEVGPVWKQTEGK